MTCLGILLWLMIMPLLWGILLLHILKREITLSSCITAGYLVIWAACEVTAVPLILLRIPYHIFVWVFTALLAAGALLSLILAGKEAGKLLVTTVKDLKKRAWTVYAAAAAVLVQCYFYFCYMVTNQDDAYFVAAAVTAIETDKMYLASPYTGRFVSVFNLRYILSPFPMWQAFLSTHLRVNVPVLAHTILPVFLVVLAYFVYVLLGRLLFLTEDPEKNEKERESCELTGLFVLAVSFINITSYYCVRNWGGVLLVRIWQGKAVLAAVILPFIFWLCYRMREFPDEKGSTVLLAAASCACCLVSSMGIALPVVMMGIFALLFGIGEKRRDYFFRMIAGCIPCVVFGCTYIVLCLTA